MKVRYILGSTSILASIVGCQNVAEPSIRRLAAIDSQVTGRIDAPDSVRANVAFNVTVYAVESSSLYCNQPDGTSITVEGNVARIKIYVRYPNVRDLTCPSDAKLYPYVVSVRFQTAGVGIVRSIGSRNPGARPEPLDSISRTVVVIP